MHPLAQRPPRRLMVEPKSPLVAAMIHVNTIKYCERGSRRPSCWCNIAPLSQSYLNPKPLSQSFFPLLSPHPVLLPTPTPLPQSICPLISPYPSPFAHSYPSVREAARGRISRWSSRRVLSSPSATEGDDPCRRDILLPTGAGTHALELLVPVLRLW